MVMSMANATPLLWFDVDESSALFVSSRIILFLDIFDTYVGIYVYM